MAALTGLVNFAVTAGNQILEVTPRGRFRGECADTGEIGRSALKQQVELSKIIEAHPQVGFSLQLIQQALELSPITSFGSEESWQIDDHVK